MSVKEKRDLKHVSWQTENSVHEFGIKRLFDVLWQEVFVRTYLALPCFRTLRVVSNPVMVRLCVCDSESVEEKGLEGVAGGLSGAHCLLPRHVDEWLAEEEKLPTGEWWRRAHRRHDEWGRKAAGGHKSISLLLFSLLRWILPYTSSCPVLF